MPTNSESLALYPARPLQRNTASSADAVQSSHKSPSPSLQRSIECLSPPFPMSLLFAACSQSRRVIVLVFSIPNRFQIALVQVVIEMCTNCVLLQCRGNCLRFIRVYLLGFVVRRGAKVSSGYISRNMSAIASISSYEAQNPVSHGHSRSVHTVRIVTIGSIDVRNAAFSTLRVQGNKKNDVRTFISAFFAGFRNR